MSNFSYGYTCPDINKEIKSFDASLSDRLDEIFEELCPLFSGTNEAMKWRENWRTIIYNDAEPCFESVRDCNSNIRDEAEKQIDAVAKERDEYRKLYEESQDRVNELETEVDRLGEEVSDLQQTINDGEHS